MNKNPLVIIILVLCLVSLILGFMTPTKYKKDRESATQTQSKNNIGKIISGQLNKVAVISIDGVISAESSKNVFSEGNSSLTAYANIRTAVKDDTVKGIMLRINTPGGTVAMSQMLFDEILRARKVKPVIAVQRDMATSGGYYVSAAADRIFAMPGTMTGSIGVIMSTPDFHRLMSEKLLISENVIKSGKYKDIGSSTRGMTDEEKRLLQDIIDDSYLQFKDAIVRGRIERKDSYKAEKTQLNKDTLNTYADGRIFTGRQAQKLGFVDSLGGIFEAEATMKSMVKQKYPAVFDVEFVNYTANPTFVDFLRGSESGISSKIDSILPTSMRYVRQPMYLWE